MDKQDEEFLRDILMTIGNDNFIRLVDILEKCIIREIVEVENGNNFRLL